MMKKLMALIGYVKIPIVVVHASIHQESGLYLQLASAKLDLVRIKDLQKQAGGTLCEEWAKKKAKEIVHLEIMIVVQKELTVYLQSCRRLAG